MKVEINVPEVVNLFKEIEAGPAMKSRKIFGKNFSTLHR